MHTPETIQECFNTKTLKYLQRKRRGGSSGQKGTRYEDYFAVYKLAQLAQATLEAGLAAHFSSQVLAFVDDLIIDVDSNPVQYYQLKNSPNVSWSTGKNPIQSDFANQHHLTQESLARDSHLFLVVSDRECSEHLRNEIPPSLKAFSQVLHFPYDPSIMTLIKQMPDFWECLAYLSAFEIPEPDKIEYVAKALLGAWITNECSQVSALDLLTEAQQQTPQFIRSFVAEFELDAEVQQILSNIEDFTYNLAKGFLHWNYANGLQSGTLPYSIDTADFRRLQERIKSHKPKDFENELEDLL